MKKIMFRNDDRLVFFLAEILENVFLIAQVVMSMMLDKIWKKFIKEK